MRYGGLNLCAWN